MEYIRNTNMNNVMKFFGGVLWVLTVVVLLATAPAHAQVAPTDTATTTISTDTASSTPPTDTATSTPAVDTATSTPAADADTTTPSVDTATSTPAADTTVTSQADTATSTAPAEVAHLAIRLDGTLIGPFDVDLSTIGATSTIDLAPTNATTTYAIPARSVLALLVALDAAHDEFAVSDLSYYASFGAFYLKCITFAALAAPACDQWTYSVNGASPWSGVDSYTLQNGDIAYLYFGSKHRTYLATSTVDTNSPLVATAQMYDPITNTFTPLLGVTLGVTQYDPANPWTPIEVATSTVDQNGEATFSIGMAGSYSVGIKEDYYWPSVVFTVADALVETTPETPAPASSGGSGGVPAGSIGALFDSARAFAYLAGVQGSDGSFGSLMVTDWVAIAFGDSGAPSEAKEKLRAYLVSANIPLSSVTDYERHAMALEAMAIDPRTGTTVDHIAKIVDSFDGVQIGDGGLVNDDIFAIFPLLRAGYTADDEIIKKIALFIVSKQEANGSWGSTDMTAAAVQALALLQGEPGVSAALAKAKTYLQAEQQNDGGFGNSFATSWVVQAISATNEPVSSWVKNGKSPHDYLAGAQQADGGVEPTSNETPIRAWATAYAVPAALGKPWHALLKPFAKPVPVAPSTNSGGAGGGSTANTSMQVVATTTFAIATSTLLGATTTPELATSTVAIATATTSTSMVTQKTQNQHTQTVKAKPAAPAPAPAVKSESNKDRQASVPENKGSSAITQFFSSLWGRVVTAWKWLF